MTTATKLLVTDKEAAAMLCMGTSTLWRAVKKGMAPAPIKIAGITRWRVSDLQQHIADLSSSPTNA